MLNMFRSLFKQHKTHPELASVEHIDPPFIVTVMTLSLELLNYINYIAFSITNNLHIKQMEYFLLLIKIKPLTTAIE